MLEGARDPAPLEETGADDDAVREGLGLAAGSMGKDRTAIERFVPERAQVKQNFEVSILHRAQPEESQSPNHAQ